MMPVPDRCPHGRRRYTSGGPARCPGGFTEARCLCYPTIRTRFRTWRRDVLEQIRRRLSRARA
jgi:hypothetical protein